MFCFKSKLVVMCNRIDKFQLFRCGSDQGNWSVVVFITDVSRFIFDDWNYDSFQEISWQISMPSKITVINMYEHGKNYYKHLK